MRSHLGSLPLLGAVLLLSSASSADNVEYITEMSAYSMLAPCAGSALFYAVAGQTNYNSCGEDATALQECICSNSGLSQEVSSSWSSDVFNSCGGLGATDDHTSASRVYDKYCNPNAVVRFPTPTTNVVNAYITDIAEMDYLAPCASEGLSYAVMSMSQERCPESASLFASCVCSKSAVVADVKTTISRSVRSSCSNDEDVTSAVKFYNAYCNMQEGTTAFEKPSSPPGDMSYYITALPQYESLAGCAQSGVEDAIFQQTYSLCGDGPQELASCVCIKSRMSGNVLSLVSSVVRYSCERTATQHVTSAMDLFDYYCSAAKGEVTASVDESVSQTFASEATRTGTNNGPEQTNDSGGGSDGKSGDSQSDGNENDDSEDGGGGGGGGAQTATIAASVLGGVIAIALIGGLAWWIRRRKLKAKAAEGDPPSAPASFFQNPELHGDDSRDISKTGTPVVSEQAARHPPELGAHGIVEMDQTQPGVSELQPYSRADQYVTTHPAYEMYSPTEVPTPSPGPTSPQTNYSTVSPASPQHNGLGWQSGPVNAYEMGASQPDENRR